jgi:integrase
MIHPWRSRIGSKIDAYLTLKKSLGRQYVRETQILIRLDRFLARRRVEALTAEAFTAWVKTFVHISGSVRRARMQIVRNLCLYLRRTDHAAFVPDPQTFPARSQPRRPHIFSDEQIVRLIRVASQLPSVSTTLLRANAFRLAVVLLYTLGLRCSEVARLTISDYDLAERTLLVRASKFRKTRLIALSKSAADELERYLVERRRLTRDRHAPLLVHNQFGPAPYTAKTFGMAMQRLIRQADVRMPDGRFPHVHDLRHTFAVHALLRWYRAGVDVQAKLPALSIAMGHASVSSTAYYLQLLEPVAEAASVRFDRHWHKIIARSARRAP